VRRALRRGWVDFFFTPADPTALGLIRIAVGLLLLWNLGMLGVDLRANLGSTGWAGSEAAREFLDTTPGAWSFWLWVPDAALPAVWAASMIVLALVTAGLFTRVTAVLAWAIVVATARRSPVLVFGFDQIVATWALYLAAFGAGGQALALDRLLARRRRKLKAGPPAPTVSANLSLRLIQLHLCLIYGAAGLAKLRGDAWWDGSAMEFLIVTPEFRRFDLAWLAAYPLVLNLATHGALALEVGYPVLIWFKPLRPLLIASVFLMHVGIDLTLGLTEFGLAMLAGNLAFASGPWLRGLSAKTRGQSAGS